MLNVLFFTLFFFGVFVENAHAYLDPGTSSLLLSSIVAIFASIVFALKGFFYKITSGTGFSFKRASQADKQKGIVIYSEGRQYFSTFKPIVDEFERRNYPYTYYTSDEKDPILEFKTQLGHIEFIGSSNDAYRKLNSLVADICLVTFPQLDVLQIKRSKGVAHYCHLLHALSHVDTYEIFALDYFDSVLSNSPIHTDFIRRVEDFRHLKKKEICIVGCTYLDYLQEKLKTLHLPEPSKNQPPTILVAPSWGRNALFAKYGMRLLKPLLDIGYPVIIRPHPQSYISQAELLQSLKEQTAHYTNLKWDSRTDNIFAMAESSLMISDFSGVLVDYIALFNRPVLTPQFEFNTVGYDIQRSPQTTPWAKEYLPTVATIFQESDLNNLKALIDSALVDAQKARARAESTQLLWQHPGEAGKRSALELIRIHKGILEQSLGAQLETRQQLIAINAQLKNA